MKPAVVLLSGGLDSATCLAIAKRRGFECYALSARYGQRHDVELAAAERVAETLGVADHEVVDINLAAIGGSALTDTTIPVPEESGGNGIPVTYVPARNTILLGLALGWAEVLNAKDIIIGVNAVDYSGYPDCRPAFIQAFTDLAGVATKAGVEEGARFKVHTPLINLSKAQIIQAGIELGIDYSLTVSCYQADRAGHACGRCDACRFRKQGFSEAGIPDPTLYRN